MIDQVVGEIDLELTELKIAELKSDLVIGRTQVTLPGNADFTGQIEQVLSSVVIIVPAGVELQLTGKPLIGAVNIPESYIKQGDVFSSPGYEEGVNKVTPNLGLVIGQVEIRQR